MAVPRREFLTAHIAGAAWPRAGAAAAPPATPAAQAGGWRPEVPALAQMVSGRPLAYLDNAATTLRPRQVIDALVRFYERDNANPSASLHTLARRSAAALDAARLTVARFLNAADPREVIFTRGTTEGINLVAATWGAASVRAGDDIVLTLAEHASNLFPWQRLAAERGARLTVVGVHDDGRLRMDEIDAAITSRTRLVAVTHVSNVLGLVYPVADICALARRRGAAVLIDAAQSAPHVKLDMRTMGCDFLAFSAHKMLGPMGVGVLWVHPDRLREMPAYHVGSNMAHGTDLGSAALEPGALRFQAGTPNVSGPVALAAAIDILEAFTFEAIAAHDRTLCAHALKQLAAVPGLRLIGTSGPDQRAPVFAFTLAGVPVPRIVEAADAAGIAVRGGDLAALPLLRRFGVDAAARASAYLYNTVEEIDRLAAVLTSLARPVRG